MCLIAMLATARDGEHSRAWLQEKLWGSRSEEQARASLRRELSNLRRLLNRDAELLSCGYSRVKLDLTRVWVDARHDQPARPSRTPTGEFLEGFDVPGEEGFEDWLREQRGVWSRSVNSAADAGGGSTTGRPGQAISGTPSPVPALKSSAPPLPETVLDTSLPAPGFNDHPALAVITFANLTGGRESDYLAEGIADELITRFSRLRWLPVIAGNSSRGFVESAMDPSAIGRRLGVKYLLGGRLRREADGLAVATTLADTANDHTIWSKRFLLPATFSQDALEQLIVEVVGAVGLRIDHAEQRRARALPRVALQASDLVWRGRWHLNRLNRADAEIAQSFFRKALEVDPYASEALIQSTLCLGWTIWAERRPLSDVAEMRTLAQRAIFADPDDGRGYMLAGISELWLRRFVPAKNLLVRAIELNPSLVQAHCNLGSLRILSGEPAAAFAPLKTAMRLSPNDVHMFHPLGELAMAHLLCRQWDDAVEHADLSLSCRGRYWYAHVVKVNALVRKGEAAAAAAALEAFASEVPSFSDQQIGWLPFGDRRTRDYLREGIELARATERI